MKPWVWSWGFYSVRRQELTASQDQLPEPKVHRLWAAPVTKEWRLKALAHLGQISE